MTIKQLRALVQVVETGSVTRAAENLFLTAPAVSNQIKLLEQAAETELLQRRSQGMVPTDCGRELYALAKRLEVALESTAERLGALKAGKVGSVGVGVVSTAKYFAPGMLAAFQQACPEVDLRLIIGNREEVLSALKSAVVDIAIMSRTPTNAPISFQYMGEHPFGMIASPDHKLASLRMVPANRLLSETMLLREEGSGTRALTQRYLEQYGSGRSYRSLEMTTNESIKQSVMAGMGVAMLSLHTVLQELSDGRLVALKAPGLPIMRRWILVRMERGAISGAAQQCHDFIMRHLHEYMPPADPAGALTSA